MKRAIAFVVTIVFVFCVLSTNAFATGTIIAYDGDTGVFITGANIYKYYPTTCAPYRYLHAGSTIVLWQDLYDSEPCAFGRIHDIDYNMYYESYYVHSSALSFD